MSIYSSIGKQYTTLGDGIPRLPASVRGAGAIALVASTANGGLSNAQAGSGPLGKIVAGAAGQAGIGASGGGRAVVPASSIAQAQTSVAPATSGFGRFMQGPVGSFITSTTGGGLIAGLGAGIASALNARAERKQQEAIRDSYKVGSEALHGKDIPSGGQPTPDRKWQRPTYNYDPQSRTIVRSEAQA